MSQRGSNSAVAAMLAADSIALMRPSEEKLPLGWAEFDNDSWVQHRGGGPGFASIL